MKNIILCTNNEHKLKELSAIFGNKVSLTSLKDINFHDDIIENGNSFIENALIKCETVFKNIQKPVMADDSGICVNALDGKPGIYSARYGGEGLSDKERYQYLLHKLDGKDDLNASFVCALVLYLNPNRIFIVQEETKGIITFTPKGNNGFGYDPIFYLPDLNKTAAELSDKEKNRISHRGKAAKKMSLILKNTDI